MLFCSRFKDIADSPSRWATSSVPSCMRASSEYVQEIPRFSHKYPGLILNTGFENTRVDACMLLCVNVVICYHRSFTIEARCRLWREILDLSTRTDSPVSNALGLWGRTILVLYWVGKFNNVNVTRRDDITINTYYTYYYFV